MRNLKALLICTVLFSTPLFGGQQSSPDVNQPEIVYVKCGIGENLGVHEIPSKSATVLAKVNCGDVLISFGEEQGFYKVRTEHGLVGYIPSEFISKTKQEVPVSTSPTQPTHLPSPSPSAKKKEKPRIIVEVVETQTGQRQFTTTIPGTAGTSQTTCNTNGNGSVYGTSNGGTVNGTVNTNSTTNCTTTSQPGTPPMSFDESIAQEYVRVIWPSGLHTTLWCQAGFRKCFSLAPGRYLAEPEFDRGGHLNAVWIHANDLSGKERKINYKPVGQGW
jgi:hypothetical protein